MVGWMLAFWLLAPAPGPSELGDGPELRPGLVFEVSAEALTVAEYRLPDLGDDFVRVVVEQGASDVELTVLDREGEVLVRADQDPQDYPGDDFLVLPSTPGATLSVRLQRGGSYRLWAERVEAFDPARPGVSDDRRRLAAERFATEAANRRALGTEAGRREALELLRRSAELFEAAGDPVRQGWMNYWRGTVLTDLGDTEQAVRVYAEVLDHWIAYDDLAGQGVTHLLRGISHGRRGELDLARQDAETARSLFGRLGFSCGEARALNNLGRLEQGRDPRAAIPFFDQALEVCGGGVDPELEAALLLNRGGVHSELGEPEEAIVLARRALEWLERLGNERLARRTRVNLGFFNRRLGRVGEAFEWYHQALVGAERAGDRHLEATLHNSLGSLYRVLGEDQRAESHLERSLALRREVADRRGEAVTLANLGRVALLRDEATEARRWLDASLALRRELGNRRSVVRALVRLAEAERLAGDLAAAKDRLEEASAGLAELGDRELEARVAREVGTLHLAAGDPGEAVASLAHADAIQGRLDQRLARIETLPVLARAQRRAGDTGGALSTLAAAKGLAETLRLEVGDPELRASFFGAVYAIAEEEIALRRLLHRADPEAGHDRRAFEASESARARGLRELLAEAETGARLDVDPRDWTRRQALLHRASTKSAAARRLDPASATRQRLEAELVSVLEDLRALEAELRQHSPTWDALEAEAPTVEAIAELLDEETALLEIALGDEASTLWVVERGDFALHVLPPRAEIEEVVRRLLPAWSQPGVWGSGIGEQMAWLSDTVLGPARAALDRSRRVVVVADGGLHAVPFAALPVPGEVATGDRAWMAERWGVVHLPSAAVLRFLRRAGHGGSSEDVLVVADPVFAVDDPRLEGRAEDAAAAEEAPARLPASRREAQAILALAGDRGRALLDTRASRRALGEEALEDLRVLHFATHGVLDTRHPRLSGLELSRFDEAGRPIDGFLSLGELYDRRIGAELVVLSACRTALGRQVRGEGVVGLPRGFLHAGARAVIASLWPVQDRATARWMERFYQALLQEGATPAEALEVAQHHLRSDPLTRHPYYWAGFVLVGDWQ